MFSYLNCERFFLYIYILVMWLFKILLRFSLWLLTVWQWCYLGAIFFCFCVYHISASLSFFHLWVFFSKSVLENVWPFSLRIFLLFHFLSPLLELQLRICRNFTYAPHVSYFKCSSSLCSIVCSYLSYLPLCKFQLLCVSEPLLSIWFIF